MLACIHPYTLPVCLPVRSTFRPHVTKLQTHAQNTHTQGCVYQSQPCDHTWPRSRLLEANNTSHVQVSINRSFDGGYWEFQARGEGDGRLLGYLASQTRGSGGGGGGGGDGGSVWASSGPRRREVEVLMAWCFSRSRRGATVEPQRTLAAVSGGGSKYGRPEQSQDVT